MLKIQNMHRFVYRFFLSFTIIAVSHRSVKANDLVPSLTQQDFDDRCAQIEDVEGLGAYIFKEPDVYSERLGTVEVGRYVELEGDPIEEYYPVSVPLQGYIHEDFLTSCITAKPPENCLQVASTEGIIVYKEPTEQSEAIGEISNGKNVRVEEMPTGDWIPVLAPLNGYAPKDKLSTCPPARFE